MCQSADDRINVTALLTGFQERVVSKCRQVSIPLNVKSTAEGQTHASARQRGLKGGRSEGRVISHTTAEIAYTDRFHVLAAMRGGRQCETIGVSPLGRKSGGAPAGQRAGVLAVTEAQSLSVKSVDVICLLL